MRRDGSQLRDKNGLTEEEFLAQYTPKKYPQPSLTADICVFRRNGEGTQLLLVQRGGHPYLGCWATPGGFANPNETADQCAARELAEETGEQGLDLEPLRLYSTPGRDPRGWTVSYAFVALDRQGVTVHAGDDAARAVWFDVVAKSEGAREELTLAHGDDVLHVSFGTSRLPISGLLRATDVKGDGLAFDHANIIADAWLLVQGR
ncbi:MAG: NUDIX hydrolase [Olsenella sp.]|jgi:ADP-ribose pyrophosphatase YjhB (NUDIX family)|nr:NUDIX hydrolase [Olsenella sp.]